MTEYVIPTGRDAEPLVYIAINGVEHSVTAGVPFTPSAAVLEVLQASHFADDLQIVPDEGGGGPPEGMAFIFAENGDPVLDQDGEQIYALEAA